MKDSPALGRTKQFPAFLTQILFRQSRPAMVPRNRFKDADLNQILEFRIAAVAQFVQQLKNPSNHIEVVH